jgi:hypothetical protein
MLAKIAALFCMGWKKWVLTLIIAVFGLISASPNIALAVPENPTTPTDVIQAPPADVTPETPADETEGEETTEEEEEEPINTCYDQVGAIGWLVCPTTGAIAKAIDSIYLLIGDLLRVEPLTTDSGSPIYLVWEYARNITNIVFIIFILIVVYSQITGFGISNYGIKKTLPRIIIAAVLVNMSFFICSLAVDISNILGFGLRGVFTSIQEATIAAGSINPAAQISWGDVIGAITGGGVIAALGIGLSGGFGALIWVILPIVFAAFIAILTGLLTLAARQALIALLIMISPIAFIAYLLPNTEKFFNKWKDLLLRMLIFFPMFSLLFGASQLAGWAIITSANSSFGVLLGMAVQVFPLFFCFSLMKMSGTILGKLNDLARKPFSPAQKALQSYSASRRTEARRSHAAFSRGPSASLLRYMENRKKFREDKLADAETELKSGATSYSNQKMGATSNLPWRRGAPTRAAERHKTAAVSKMEAESSAKDLEHYMSNYSQYYGNSQNAAEQERARQLADRGWKAYQYAGTAATRASIDDFNDERARSKAVQEAHKAGTGSADYQRLITNAAGGRTDDESITAVVASAYSTFNKLEKESLQNLKTYYDTNAVSNKKVRANLATAIRQGDKVGITAGIDRLAQIGQGFEVFGAMQDIEVELGDFSRLYGGDKEKILDVMRHMQSTITANQTMKSDYVEVTNWAKRIVTPQGQLAFLNEDGTDLVLDTTGMTVEQAEAATRDYNRKLSLSSMSAFMKAGRGFEQAKLAEALNHDYAGQEFLNENIHLLQFNDDGSHNYSASRPDAELAAKIIANGKEKPKNAEQIENAFFFKRDIEYDPTTGQPVKLKVNKQAYDFSSICDVATNLSGSDWGDLLDTTFHRLTGRDADGTANINDQQIIMNMNDGTRQKIKTAIQTTLASPVTRNRIGPNREIALRRFVADLDSLPPTP